ncbi:MAG TPA: hypothetical protein PLD47_00930 [Aggregatilineales bacterium]|nr:hypothetical protein [Anaerolineales bacterium]HRE46262.1 hypothetical protein [Aggregatilineales bacterium]
MATLEMMAIPVGVDVTQFSSDGLTFDYPSEALIAEFPDPETPAMAIIVETETDDDVQIDLTFEPLGEQTARERAETVYKAGADDDPNDQHVPPFPLMLGGLEGWRTRKLFYDGAVLVIDTTFVDTAGGRYAIELAAPPDVYAQYQWVLDLMLQTMAFA